MPWKRAIRIDKAGAAVRKNGSIFLETEATQNSYKFTEFRGRFNKGESHNEGWIQRMAVR